MGNEQSQQKAKKGPAKVPITKIQFDCMCMKLKGYFDISISRKQAEVNQKCKDLLNMIRSPQRNRESELHKMISIAQDRNYIKGLEMLNRYCDIILSRSQQICQSQSNPQQIKELFPMIDGLVWSTQYVNLKSLGEFTTVMRNFFGTEDYYTQVQSSTFIDPQLKKCFEMLPQNSYTVDINILAILMCQQGLTLEEINKPGHPFSQNTQQFYQNIGLNPNQQQQQQVYPNQQQQQQQQQQYPQFPQQFQPQQYPNPNYQQQQNQMNNYAQPPYQNIQQNGFPQQNQQFQQPAQNFQQNQPQNNFQQNPANLQQNPNHLQQNPANFQQQQQQQQQQFQQQQQQIQNQQFNNNFAQNQVPINPLPPSQVNPQNNYQVNVQPPQNQQNQHQPQVDQNGNPLLFPVVNSVNVFGQNFINSYNDVYKSNNINEDDYSYPTFSKLQDSQNIPQQNQDDQYIYVQPQQQNQMNLGINNNQLNINNGNNLLIPSAIMPANKFVSNNQINNGQLPQNFKFQNMIESKDIPFANQINNNLNNINPNGIDLNPIKQQIEQQGMNVGVVLPQLNVIPSCEFKQQNQNPIMPQQEQPQESPKKNLIKYPSLNNKQSSLENAHNKQINNIQNNIQKQNQILTLKQQEEQMVNDLQSKLQLLQLELQQQTKGINSKVDQQNASPYHPGNSNLQQQQFYQQNNSPYNTGNSNVQQQQFQMQNNQLQKDQTQSDLSDCYIIQQQDQTNNNQDITQPFVPPPPPNNLLTQQQNQTNVFIPPAPINIQLQNQNSNQPQSIQNQIPNAPPAPPLGLVQQQNSIEINQPQQVQIANINNNQGDFHKAQTLNNNQNQKVQQIVYQSYMPNQINNHQKQDENQINVNNLNQAENNQENKFTPSSDFESERIQIMDVNQILKEMNIDIQDKNVLKIINSQDQQQNQEKDQDFMMSNIIKEVNDMRNTVNFNQNEYQDNDGSSHPVFSKK
ncbi:hypothetical protein ABPG74_016587 [Tetrahymena malaccensis]